MPKHHKTVTRSLAAGLAVCAIAPGTALAVPATDGPPAAGSGRPGVSAQDYQSLDYRAPTQTGSRADGATQRDRRAQGQTHGRGDGRCRGADRAAMAGQSAADRQATSGRDGDAVE